MLRGERQEAGSIPQKVKPCDIVWLLVNRIPEMFRPGCDSGSMRSCSGGLKLYATVWGPMGLGNVAASIWGGDIEDCSPCHHILGPTCLMCLVLFPPPANPLKLHGVSGAGGRRQVWSRANWHFWTSCSMSSSGREAAPLGFKNHKQKTWAPLSFHRFQSFGPNPKTVWRQ